MKNRFSCPSGYDELKDQITARTRCVLACGRPNGDLSKIKRPPLIGLRRPSLWQGAHEIWGKPQAPAIAKKIIIS